MPPYCPAKHTCIIIFTRSLMATATFPRVIFFQTQRFNVSLNLRRIFIILCQNHFCKIDMYGFLRELAGKIVNSTFPAILPSSRLKAASESNSIQDPFFLNCHVTSFRRARAVLTIFLWRSFSSTLSFPFAAA